ncbi:hypothetical protein BBW65_02370 [Helicobacter enhydrae]|uniref:TerC family integral membrane protein n=1 Tax=Helicobacter enhydrae TaxID=222136 RepID=A0A1B1U4P5_9HELI|nr:hypothetical protein [Helicobacter enhydrae]ANV97719.1 hypothetical protein BBW65_02370 [Helicobacter enhydrae]
MNELNLIAQAFSSLTFYHKFFSAFFALPFVLNLFNLYTIKNFATLNKKIWFYMPLIFFLLSVAIFSGLTLIFMQQVFFSLRIVAMSLFCLFVLIAEITRIKRLKIARRTNEQAMLDYIRFCKKIYSLDLLLFAIVFWGI